MSTGPSLLARAAARARGQHGLVTLAQLTGLGARTKTIERWLAGDRLERLHPRVYRMAGVPGSYEQDLRAAVFAAGGLAVVSHRAACHLWRIDAPGVYGQTDAPPVEITVRTERRPRVSGAIVHRSLDLVPEQVTVRDAIPVTNPLRLLVDLGAVVPDFLVARALDQLLVKRLVTEAEVVRMHRALAKRGRRGCGVLRRVLDARALDCDEPDSPAEEVFASLCREHGLIEPTYQHEIRAGGRRYHVDFAYPDRLIAVEIDGWAFHGSHEAFQRDRTRSNELVALGWTVLRFTWSDLVLRPGYVARIVRAALADRSR